MVVSAPKITKPRVKRWTRDEYHRMIDVGAFQKQRVYLFRGELIEMPPQNHPHGYTVTKLSMLLNQIFDAARYDIRTQVPFCPPGESEPEPDVLVCTTEQGLQKPHPSSALLIVEVSDSSLREDRAKAEEYAAAGVPDYWIIDVNNRRTEIHREPIADASAHLGWRYSETKTYAEHEPLTPLSALGKTIVLSNILPFPNQ